MTESNFTCPICGDSFETVRELEQHSVHAHSSAEKARLDEGSQVICQLCGSSFPNQARLELHMQQHHPDQAAATGSGAGTHHG